MTETRTPLTLTDVKAMRAEQIAALMADPEGNRELTRVLRGEPPLDPGRLGDSDYLRSLSPEQVADNWSAIHAAMEGTK